jgi:predicted transcriptional regulator
MSDRKEKSQLEKEIIASGDEALKIAEALNETTMRLLQTLWKEPLDVSTIAIKLGLSEAYISEQVKLLENLRLLRAEYAPGKRGIRKICYPVVEQVTVIIREKG